MTRQKLPPGSPRRTAAENHAFSPLVPFCGEMAAATPEETICRADIFPGKMRYDRLSSMAFWSIWSAVVTTLLLDWKPRWVMIMLTISVAMSTLESSILYA